MSGKISCLCLLLLLAGNIVRAQHDPHHWPNRTGIVHLFEWKFGDIAKECERFLSSAGFAAVQVSPINENAIVSKRPWWERYQPISYNIITRSGTEDQFKNMVDRCNKVGIRIYVDVILNHMAAGNGIVIGTGGSRANISSRSYPAVPYVKDDFHPSCAINNYNDKFEVRNCELVGLPDLNQTKEHVRERAVHFLNHLVDLGVAGFRVDAAKHMWPDDLKVIYERIKNLSTKYFPQGSRPFIYQEVIDLGSEAVKKTEYNSMGAVTEFKFSTEIGKAFGGNNMLKWLVSWGPEWGMLPSNDALVFVDNHDNQRSSGTDILTYKVPDKYKSAVTFMLAHPYGIPRVMSSFNFTNSDQGPPADRNGRIISPTIIANGQCGAGWVCEHRWTEIANMIRFRNEVKNLPITNWWDNGNNQIAFCRGNKGMIFFNNENQVINQAFQTCLVPGIYCDVITGVRNGNLCTGRNVTVDRNSEALIQIRKSGGILALHAGDMIPVQYSVVCNGKRS